ncbi:MULTISPECIES: hypothetical protein [unclassified Microcoleus]|uniref:hypothetical protein n=1 Tax=unclassified Microcoleus TaxID=2642155 RepID=UPI002FD3E0BC
MKTESIFTGVANYSETIYEFENELDWLEHLNQQFLTPGQKRFSQGKCDALFLIEPESDDFDYLCGWHWQTEKLIQDAEALNLEFGEF